MRVLKTMNSVGEITRQDLAGLNINDIAHDHRRNALTLNKVCILACRCRLCFHETKR